jgi:hypothetical protein
MGSPVKAAYNLWIAAARYGRPTIKADRAIRLDRALVDERRARMDRGAAVPLEDERRDPAVTEEDGGRQPDEAAAEIRTGTSSANVRKTASPSCRSR